MGASAAALSIESCVQLSWDRCRSQYLLGQNEWNSPRYVGVPELERRRRLAGYPYATACAELAALASVLRGPIGLALTDRDAVILTYLGNAGFNETARQFGMSPGAVWSEAEQGTNGMGTCVAECAAVAIEQQHHYLRRNAVLSCYAVPILDGSGELVGALSASTMGVLSSAPMIALLDLVAQNIERRALIEGFKDHYVIRLHEQREFLGTSHEAILVVDQSGCVVATNRAAREVFESKSHASLCGLNIELLIGEEIGCLSGLANRAPEPRLLTRASFFAVVQAPVSPRANKQASQNNPSGQRIEGVVEQAERAALLESLTRHDGNVTRAAGELGVSRRTLHRKLRQYKLTRDRNLS